MFEGFVNLRVVLLFSYCFAVYLVQMGGICSACTVYAIGGNLSRPSRFPLPRPEFSVDFFQTWPETTLPLGLSTGTNREVGKGKEKLWQRKMSLFWQFPIDLYGEKCNGIERVPFIPFPGISPKSSILH